MAILEAGGTGFVDHNPVKALLARDDSVVTPSSGPLPKIAEPVFTRPMETADPGNWRHLRRPSGREYGFMSMARNHAPTLISQ
jgi:hypothetical protein